MPGGERWRPAVIQCANDRSRLADDRVCPTVCQIVEGGIGGFGGGSFGMGMFSGAGAGAPGVEQPAPGQPQGLGGGAVPLGGMGFGQFGGSSLYSVDNLNALEQRPPAPKDMGEWIPATNNQIWWYGKAHGRDRKPQRHAAQRGAAEHST